MIYKFQKRYPDGLNPDGWKTIGGTFEPIGELDWELPDFFRIIDAVYVWKFNNFPLVFPLVQVEIVLGGHQII